MERSALRALIEGSPVRLAPMASYTNAPFRQVALRCGSGFVTNEEIDAEALLRDNVRTAELARVHAADGPLAMQLLGGTAEALVPAALRLVAAGAAMIDINMGCPVPKVVRKGKGAALMRDVGATADMLAELRRALDVPLTIKIRGGWDDHVVNAVEVARMAQDVGVDAITVHPRTRAQRYGGQAPWTLIAEVVQAVSIPVTGNGDVTSLTEAQRMMAVTGCAAVMVGRAALGRPWLFDATHAALPEASRVARETAILAMHLDLIEDLMDPHAALIHAKKQVSAYAAGHPGASSLRARVFALRSLAEVRAICLELWPAIAMRKIDVRATGGY